MKDDFHHRVDISGGLHTMACIPSNWESLKRKQHPTAENNEDRPNRVRRLKESSMACNVLHRIENCLQGAPDSYEHEPLKLEKLVEALPFAKLLHNIPKSDENDVLPIVTRAYEEQYMREPLGPHEHSCIMEQECECMFIDDSEKFVGVQFLLPEISNKHFENSLCVLCLRKITQLLYYKTVHLGIQTDCRIQKYGNICGVPDEYHSSVMLLCPPGVNGECMPYPIVAHQRNRYTVEKVGGVRYMKQHRVYFSDF